MVGTTLEETYTFNEIAALFAKKIKTSGFMPKLNAPYFLEWFKQRESIGIRFDWKLVARAFAINNEIDNVGDHFTVIVGREGSGKTTAGQQLCSWVSPTMTMEDIVFDMPQYINRLKALNAECGTAGARKRSILIDEGGVSLFSREALSKSNVLLAKSFMVQRQLGINVVICIPHYWSLDSMIRDHRIKTLIIIKSRGSYRAIVGRGIKILNKLGSKDKTKDLLTIPIPYGFFWEGNFRKGFTKNINEEEYIKHKSRYITRFLDEASTEAASLKMIKLSRLTQELGLNAQTLINYIQTGEIEGKKIGGNWFVTYKAYEKLLNIGKEGAK